MDATTASSDDELKALQIENAKFDSRIKQLDISLKEFELRHKPGFWKGVLASPAFLAALIAIFATGATASVSWIIASQQRQLDEQRSSRQLALEREKNTATINTEWTKLQATLLSGILLAAKPDESCPIATQLGAFLDAGVFTDIGFREEAQKLRRFYDAWCSDHNK
jgi:hypothetical protein